MDQKDILEFKLYNNNLLKKEIVKDFSLIQKKRELLENRRKIKNEIKRILGEYNA